MKPGETRELTVVFYVDPAIAKDHEQDTLDTITLSYTFYRLPEQDRPVAEAPDKNSDQTLTETTMADAHAKHHDYHLVDPSPWPAVGATSAFVMAFGGIAWMHHMFAAAPLVFGAGVIGILYTFLGWWRDVVREAQYDGFHTRVVQISHRYGMILFIASEVMFFVAWFWAYFNTALFPGRRPTISAGWPSPTVFGRRPASKLSTPGTFRS